MEKFKRNMGDAFDYMELAHFRTSKTVQIHDWRLACCYWTMVILMLVWVGMTTYSSHSHLIFVVPVGSTSHWVSSGVPSDLRFNSGGRCTGSCGQTTGYYDALNKVNLWTDENSGSFAYCNTSAYDFHYSSSWIYGPFGCAFRHASEVYKKTLDSLYFTTAAQDDTRKCFTANADATNSSACASAALTAGLSCASASYLAGTCCCSSTSFSFNAAIEHLGFEFDHSFSSMYDANVATGKGERPRTIFRDSTCVSQLASGGSSNADPEACNMFEVPAGELVSISLQKLLSHLKIDLDSDACTQPGGAESLRVNGVCPKARLSGMQIGLKMAYYNFNLHSSQSVFHEAPPLCIVDVAPKVTWNSLGSDVTIEKDPSWAKGVGGLNQPYEAHDHYRYGITVQFVQGSGRIGRFDLFSLLNAFVQAVVLLGLATTITTYLARFVMGTSSEVYEGAINERLSYKREMARFVVQSLVGHKVIEGIDLDGDGTISENELATALQSFLGKWLTVEQIDDCRTALFDLFDRRKTSSTSSVSPTQERTLDITELIDALTDDRITTDTLRQVLSQRQSGSTSAGKAGAIVRRASLNNLFGQKSANGQVSGSEHPKDAW